MKSNQTFLSLVVPMHNEQETISRFFEVVIPILNQVDDKWEIVSINDGSRDQTLAILKDIHARNSKIKIISLARNFGKENALTAGLQYACGQVVIPIDADLQDPPELIPEMVDKWRDGADVVLAIRKDRSFDSFFKKLTANLFYKFFSKISETEMVPNAGDFRLMDKSVVEALLTLPERNRFMKGLFAWLGFTQAKVYFSRPDREAGTTSWSFWKLWNFALDGITSFSTAPLRIWTYVGGVVSLSAFIFLTYRVIDTLLNGNPVAGYSSIVALILFFNGLMMLGMGVFGEYLARIFIEVKQRPLYIIKEKIGFD